jgi:hypothetical protein
MITRRELLEYTAAGRMFDVIATRSGTCRDEGRRQSPSGTAFSSRGGARTDAGGLADVFERVNRRRMLFLVPGHPSRNNSVARQQREKCERPTL